MEEAAVEAMALTPVDILAIGGVALSAILLGVLVGLQVATRSTLTEIRLTHVEDMGDVCADLRVLAEVLRGDRAASPANLEPIGQRSRKGRGESEAA